MFEMFQKHKNKIQKHKDNSDKLEKVGIFCEGNSYR